LVGGAAAEASRRAAASSLAARASVRFLRSFLAQLQRIKRAPQGR